MNRRALGAALLLLTALIAGVVPGIKGVQIVGTAIARPIPLPPVVGDCVLSARPTSPPGVAYGDCSAPHVGEVVWVFGQSGNIAQVRPGQIVTPDPSICKSWSSSYLGVDQVVPRVDRGDFRSTSFGAWLPLSTGTDELIGPNSVQESVGQHWIACVTKGQGDTPFNGTVRGAFTGGRLPDAYAMCTASLAEITPVDCTRPHRAELFATTGMTYQLPSDADLSHSCADFVHYLTGRADISANGRLRVEVKSVYYDITGHPVAGQRDPIQTQPGSASCAITTVGAAELTATLFGIGDGPLPLI